VASRGGGPFEGGAKKTKARGYRNLSQARRMQHATASQAEHVLPTTPEAYRQAIASQTCPVCGLGPWTMLAGHVSKTHGIAPEELRRLAGMRRKDSICDGDYSEQRRNRLKDRIGEGHLPRPAPREGIEAQREEMRRLYEDQGLSLRDIAERFGMEKTQVGRVLKERGVVMRDGSRSGAKLTEEEARQIKGKLGTMTNPQLAKEYNVTASLISMIRTGRAWGNLPGAKPDSDG
jgi:AraC-like DNA-binding protein